MNEYSGNEYLERASYTWSEDSVHLFATPGRTARAVYFYMQEAGYFKTKCPYFTERANLNSFLIIYTLSGSGILRYEENEFHLGEGSLFFINCMFHHEYHTSIQKDWEFLWLHFNGSNALGYYEEFVKNGFHVLQIQEKDSIESTLRRIISINQKKNITTEVLTSSLITTLLTELIIQSSTSTSQTFLIPTYIKKAEKYLDQHFLETPSLNQLADELHLNKFYLAKEFTHYIGVPPHEYLIGLKLSYAKDLLKYSEQTVGEIACLCGYNQISHFIKMFKQREHMTPLQFRKEWKL